jgi:hypothetical protein
MTDWVLLREKVLTRCSGYCELCGFGLNDTFALHHRKLRSRGGKDTLDNLIALHHECHNLGNNAVHANIKSATETGHIVPRHAEPEDYPLHLPNGSIVTLTQEGSYNVRKESNGW